MQRVEIHLKNDERTKLEAMCSSGVNQVRSLQRAQILPALDKGISDQQIADVLNIDRIRGCQEISITSYCLICCGEIV